MANKKMANSGLCRTALRLTKAPGRLSILILKPTNCPKETIKFPSHFPQALILEFVGTADQNFYGCFPFLPLFYLPGLLLHGAHDLFIPHEMGFPGKCDGWSWREPHVDMK